MEEKSTNYSKNPFRGIAGLISFSTIIPMNIHTTIEEMATFTWFWPIIGGLIGIFVGAVGFLSINLLNLPSLITAALVYSFAIWFTGFHHLDGLIDMGDGLMVHGDHQKKMEVIKDLQIGTGGISLFIIVALITFSAISAVPAILMFNVLLISEIASKISLVSCATFSKSLSEGTGRHFINSMNITKLTISLILTIIIGFLLLKFAGILGIVAGSIGGIMIAVISKKHFKYANGDVLGASNEIGRAIALLVMITILINF